MDFLIGAGLLALGMLLSRLFDSFWPSKEAERERAAAVARAELDHQASAEREEREARRAFRSQIAAPIIEMLDDLALMQRKKLMAKSYAAAVAKNRDRVAAIATKHGATVEEALALFEKDVSKITQEEFIDTLEKRLPLISRVGDDNLRNLLTQILMMPLIVPDWESQPANEKKLQDAYTAVENWIVSTGSLGGEE